MRFAVLAMILLVVILAASPSWAVEFYAEQNGKIICQSSVNTKAQPEVKLQVGQTVPVISGGQHYVIIKEVRSQPPVIKREIYIRQKNILKKVYVRVDDERIKREVTAMVASQIGQFRTEFDGKLTRESNARVAGDIQLGQRIASESLVRETGDNANFWTIVFCAIVISLGLFAVALLR